MKEIIVGYDATIAGKANKHEIYRFETAMKDLLSKETFQEFEKNVTGQFSNQETVLAKQSLKLELITSELKDDIRTAVKRATIQFIQKEKANDGNNKNMPGLDYAQLLNGKQTNQLAWFDPSPKYFRDVLVLALLKRRVC